MPRELRDSWAADLLANLVNGGETTMKKRLRLFRQSLLTILCCLTMVSSTMSSLAVYAAEEGNEPDDQYVTITYDVAPMSGEDGETVIPGSVTPAEVTVEVSDAETTIDAPEVTAAEGYEFSAWQLHGEETSLPETVADLSDEIIEAGEVTYTAVFRVAEDEEEPEEQETPGDPESPEKPVEPADPESTEKPVAPAAPYEVSGAVKTFLDAVKAIVVPEEITEENQWDLAEQLGQASAAYRELSEEEQARTDVQSAKETFDAAQEALTTFQDSQISPQNESGVTVDVDGMRYTLTTNDDGTATITRFGLPDGVTTSPETVNIPGTVTVDGTAYTVTDMNVLTAPRPYFTNTTVLTLPDTLTRISQGNFSQFRAITELTIPGNVTSYTGVMSGCKALQRVTFEEGVKEIKANGNLFGGSSSSPNNTLEEVSLPSTLESFSGGFDYCTRIKSVTFPDAVTLNNQFSMTGCTSLTEFTYPASSTMIMGSAFEGCTSLQKVTAKGTITKVGAAAFQDCTALTEIPDLSAVTQMFDYAFYNCKALKAEVDLSSLNQIPNAAFGYTPVTVTAFSENLTSIGWYAFIDSIIAVESFPDQLESIGSYAFYYAQFPSTFTLPDSLTTVSSGAFSKASGVRTLYVGTTQTGLKSLDTAAFDGVLFGTVYIAASKDEFSYKDSDQFTKVIYLYEAVDAENDKISDDADAMTLQEAVNAAAAGDADGVNVLEGGIVVLKKNVRLSKTLNVPAGNPVTIQSEGQTYTIIGPKDSGIDNLVEVQSGADITYTNVNLGGRYNKKSVIRTAGKVTLGKDVTINNATIKDSSTGVIDVNGNSASLVIDGATIKNNTISAQYSATVLVRNGASIDIQDGTITNNQYTIKDGANGTSGILMTNGTTGSMSGGTISYNTARRGAAIMLRNEDGADRIKFEMTGGSIANNKSTNGTTDTATAGGAVYLNGNAQFTMQDGEIKDNTSEYHGGGVTVVDWKLQNNRGDNNTAFIMNGGTISGNTASAGGGIYSYANGTVLNAGSITHNTADKGGALYVEGNSEHYSRTHLYNVFITDNTAEDNGVGDIHGIGGGLWLCPTGDAKVYIKNGGVLHGNTAARSGDDIAAAASSGSNYSLTLANRIMGGGKVSWMMDGTLFGSFVGSADPRSDGTNRYDENADPAPEPRVVEDSKSYQTLHSAITAADLANARKQAKLFITDNTAQQGAGIATNGGLTIGEASPIDVKVVKKWDTAAGTKTPESIDVQLLRDGKAYGDAVTLSTENDWTYTWEQLEDGYDWSVKEVDEPGGYVVKVDKNTKTGVITLTITNTEVITVKVTKVWDAPEGTATPTSVDVQLMRDGKAEGKSVTLNKENNWSYTWENLAAKYTWTVTEVCVPDRYVGSVDTKTRDDGTIEVTITNTYIPETVDVAVTKVWDVTDGKATPASVSVQLMKDGKAEGSKVTLNKDNDWSYTWEELETGHDWTVKEVNVPDGYTVSTAQEVKDGLIKVTITNKEIPEEPGTPDKPHKEHEGGHGDIHLYKVDGQTTRPIAGATFALYKSNGDYVGTYTTDADGHIGIKGADASTYYFTECKAPDGYVLDPTYVRFALKSGEVLNLKVTNTRSEVPTIMVGGAKTWADDSEATRPASITLHLYANGVEVGTVSTNASQNWIYTFGTQAVKDVNGKDIVYTVTEDAVSGYRTTVAEPVKGDGCIVINVTNTYESSNVGGMTGDGSHMALYAGLMGTAVVLIAVWLVMNRRKDI